MTKPRLRRTSVSDGVAFPEAVTVFSDPRAIDAPDLLEPDRFVILGMSQLARIQFVVFAERGERAIQMARAVRPSKGKRTRAA